MKNMRQRPRVEINHRVSCTCHDGNDQYSPPCDGMLINISTNGALLESQGPLNGRFIVIGNKSKNNPRLVKGEIVYTETIRTEESIFGVYRAGVKFTDLHENSKEFVVSIVMPNAPDTATTNDNQEAKKNSPHPEFDTKTINQILEDNTPTEELLRLDDLFEDDNTDDTGYDVLENIAEVLKESSMQDSEVTEIMIPVKEAAQEKQPVTNQTQQKHRFLFYFNAACFFTICFIITMAIVLSSPTGPKIRFPFTEEIEKILPNNSETFKLKEIISIDLISSSIKSRFVKTTHSGLNFIVSGLIRNYSETPAGEIKITGRIFDKNNLLLGKVNAMAQNDSKTIPFLVTFTNPPPDISKFSIDVGL